LSLLKAQVCVALSLGENKIKYLFMLLCCYTGISLISE
jgi:hypothetical protein